MNKKFSQAEDFLNQAYSMKDDQSKLEFYKKWADDYDKQMLENLGYTSPQTLGKALAGYLDDDSALILDIGCGTGLTAQCLVELGFISIDGIDYSQHMIEVAKQKQIYSKLFFADLNEPLEISDNYYDALICTGTFTHAHVGPEPIAELLRILKPQGFLACTVHLELWKSAGFEKTFKTLESQRRLRNLYFENDVFFKDGERDGWFCVYEKL